MNPYLPEKAEDSPGWHKPVFWLMLFLTGLLFKIDIVEELIRKELCPDIQVNVRNLLADYHLCDYLLWCAYISHSYSRGEHL